MKSSKNDFSIHKNFLITAIISFFLLVHNSVYPYEYVDGWEKI